MRSIKKLVGVMLAAFSAIAWSCDFEKLHSQKLDFNQIATALTSSSTAPAVLIEEGIGSYWIFELEGGSADASIVQVDLGSDSAANAPEYSQWNGGKVAFFSPEETIVYDLEENAVVARLKVTQRVDSDYHHWLGLRQERISGTQLLDGENANESEPGEPPHTPQTALVVAKKDGVYFTAGYHDQTLKKWSLDTGRLVDSWTLGKWYSSRKITDLRLVAGQLLAASSKGEIEVLDTDDAMVKWSVSPCEDAPYLLPKGVSGEAVRRVFYRCEGEPKYGYIKNEGASWIHKPMHRTTGVNELLVDAVALTGEHKAILAFENGLVVAVDLRTGQVDQELAPGSDDHVPSLIAYNPTENQLFVISPGNTLSTYRLRSPKSTNCKKP